MSGSDDVALTVQIVLNNLKEESNKPDIAVTVTGGGLRIFFLNWFVTNMLVSAFIKKAVVQAVSDLCWMFSRISMIWVWNVIRNVDVNMSRAKKLCSTNYFRAVVKVKFLN